MPALELRIAPGMDPEAYDTGRYRKVVGLFSGWGIALLIMMVFALPNVPLGVLAILFGTAILLASPPETPRLRHRLAALWMFCTTLLPFSILAGGFPPITLAIVPAAPLVYLAVVHLRGKPPTTTGARDEVTELKSPLGGFDDEYADPGASRSIDGTDQSPERPSTDDRTTTGPDREPIFDRRT